MNQELPLPSNMAMVQDGLDDILVVFSVDWGGFWRNASWKQRRIVVVRQLKATCMDFGMDFVLVG
jgi:hypothetical protein